jgi:hypothetical protein
MALLAKFNVVQARNEYDCGMSRLLGLSPSVCALLRLAGNCDSGWQPCLDRCQVRRDWSLALSSSNGPSRRCHAGLAADGARRGLVRAKGPLHFQPCPKANSDDACGEFGRRECCWSAGVPDATGRRWLECWVRRLEPGCGAQGDDARWEYLRNRRWLGEGWSEREDGRLSGLGWKSAVDVVLVEDCLSGKDGGDWSSKENPISWRALPSITPAYPWTSHRPEHARLVLTTCGPSKRSRHCRRG